MSTDGEAGVPDGAPAAPGGRPAFVAIDLGATSGRVVLAALHPAADGGAGARVEIVECGRFPNGPVLLPSGEGSGEVRGGLHWDVVGLWRGIVDGLRVAGREAQRLGLEIRGIGVDSWAVDYGLLDDDGRLVGTPWSYRDERTTGVPEDVYARVPAADHYSVNGLQHLPFTTEFQLVAGRDEAAWASARHLLLVPDLVTYWLTGRRVAEVTNASTTGLLDARTRTWSDDLLARLGSAYPELDGLRPRLADLVEPGAVVGPLSDPVREATGLGDVPVIAVASHDTASAVAATPLAAATSAYISSGTWSLVGLELEGPVLTEASRAANFTNELGLDGTVRYLRNVMGLWVLDECVREWSADGDPVDLGELLAAAAAEPRSEVLVDVDGDAFLAPGDMPRRVTGAVQAAGGVPPTTRPALARVVLDSLAAAYARAVERAGALAGVEVAAVHVVGGGSRNELLCRLTAEATGLPVLAGPVEATALGNVLVQARATGALGDPDGVTLADLRRVVAASTELRTYLPGR
ncbi:rhamnulokinase [Antribacter gilvus]|uniref:rhamnulokinase n=1 Tax=Antribacter gilvus TaxID=2304675 RepID=UPI001F0B9080|nr:rhamnulokinase family protein [Antribacter gilvus]